MNNKEIRWQQRFQNFEKSFLLLDKYISITKSSEIERAGIIQFFETTFELSWKLLKDYLEASGYIVKSPRDAIKKAFQIEVIEDGHTWLNALQDRNLTVHTYDEKTAAEIETNIKEKYYPLLQQLYHFMKKELKK